MRKQDVPNHGARDVMVDSMRGELRNRRHQRMGIDNLAFTMSDEKVAPDSLHIIETMEPLVKAYRASTRAFTRDIVYSGPDGRAQKEATQAWMKEQEKILAATPMSSGQTMTAADLGRLRRHRVAVATGEVPGDNHEQHIAIKDMADVVGLDARVVRIDLRVGDVHVPHHIAVLASARDACDRAAAVTDAAGAHGTGRSLVDVLPEPSSAEAKKLAVIDLRLNVMCPFDDYVENATKAVLALGKDRNFIRGQTICDIEAGKGGSSVDASRSSDARNVKHEFVQVSMLEGSLKSFPDNASYLPRNSKLHSKDLSTLSDHCRLGARSQDMER